MKLRAVHEGRKLKDVAAELLRHGLDRPETPARRAQKPRITRDPVSGLPVIHPRRSAGFVPPTLAFVPRDQDFKRFGKDGLTLNLLASE